MESSGSAEEVPPPPSPPSGGAGRSATAGRKPVCRYGKACYQKNPAHLAEYDHPWLREPEEKKPTCRYGKSCYNKNPAHLEQYAHPWLDEEEEEKKEGASGKRASTHSPSREAPGGARAVLRRLSTPPRSTGLTAPDKANSSASPPSGRGSLKDLMAERSAAAAPFVTPGDGHKFKFGGPATADKAAAAETPASAAGKSSAAAAVASTSSGSAGGDGKPESSFTSVPPSDSNPGAVSAPSTEDLQSFTKAVDDLEAQDQPACTAADLVATPTPACVDVAGPSTWLEKRPGAGASPHLAGKSSQLRIVLQISVGGLWTLNLVLGCIALIRYATGPDEASGWASGPG